MYVGRLCVNALTHMRRREPPHNPHPASRPPKMALCMWAYTRGTFSWSSPLAFKEGGRVRAGVFRPGDHGEARVSDGWTYVPPCRLKQLQGSPDYAASVAVAGHSMRSSNVARSLCNLIAHNRFLRLDITLNVMIQTHIRKRIYHHQIYLCLG